jgi:hypothetical protein
MVDVLTPNFDRQGKWGGQNSLTVKISCSDLVILARMSHSILRWPRFWCFRSHGLPNHHQGGDAAKPIQAVSACREEATCWTRTPIFVVVDAAEMNIERQKIAAILRIIPTPPTACDGNRASISGYFV